MRRAGIPLVILMGTTTYLLATLPLWAREADPAKDSWENVKRLLPGKELRVVLKDLRSYQVNLRHVTDEALVVHTGGTEQSFSRQEIQRISASGKSRRGRNLLLGGLIGGIAGGTTYIATRCRGQDPSCKEGSPAGFGVGVGAGLAVGAALASGAWRDVYRAR